MTTETISTKQDVLGMLFSEDFSLNEIETENEECVEANTEEKESKEFLPLPVTYTSEQVTEMVDAAVKQAIEKTRSEVEEEKKEQFDQSFQEKLSILEDSFLEINKNINNEVASYAQKASNSIISSVVAAFPQWSDVYDPLKASKILTVVSECFSEEFRVSIKSHPDNFVSFESGESTDVNAFDRKLGFEKDPSMNRSDFEIQWKNGSVSRDINKIVRDILSSMEISHLHS
ncbi:hypothetical protein [Acetobacter conturbans]|uniref:Flagellar assembly protein FliH/Type III secretion system HrpE domain-containing protein n=1 Tax=Acetobacter conturbans TaxID=1737472 RepID=A0ABX0K111_9PROT|nr:hypothetical protein [Acetobacter conturbans]NHN89402.1 hypothetical protein [Acetobacter conturbans]